jgi:hypothetical protein
MEFCVRSTSKFNYNAAGLIAFNLHWGVSWLQTSGSEWDECIPPNRQEIPASAPSPDAPGTGLVGCGNKRYQSFRG